MPSLRRMVSAGEPLNPEVIDAFRERRSGSRSATATARRRPASVTGSLVGDEVRDGSMGRPLPGIEVRIVDGELQVRPASCPTFFSRYLGRRAVRGRVVADRRRRPPRTRTATSGTRAAATT